MKFIPLELSGNLPDEIREEFGGGFGIWESLRMGGTGSRKLFLVKGPDDLKVLDEISVDYPTISFQHLPKAFLVRINKSNRLYGLIIRHEEIKKVLITLEMTPPADRDLFSKKTRLAIRIYLKATEDPLHFEAHDMDQNHFVKFFKKSPLNLEIDLNS